MDDAEGDRREGRSPARTPARRDASPSTRLLVPRHARRGHRRRRLRHDGARRAPTIRRVTGLSGVAPRAWLGNYRVFTVPTPIGHVANTPEIIAAFEAAVRDGMDVVNFSGGGPQIDPANDALVEAIHNLAAAGVVPVIAAGNDRDDFGIGSAGSPGTAPDAISVAAVSNTHVFAPALDVTAAGAPAFARAASRSRARTASRAGVVGRSDQTLVDVGTITGHRRQAGRAPPLRPARRSDRRGETRCRRARSRGAIALVDARALPVPDEGAAGEGRRRDRDRLRRQPRGRGERDPGRSCRPGRDDREPRRRAPRAPTSRATAAARRSASAAIQLELETGRSGVITSFSSAGPTAFGHDLKPDVSAPGGQILSSTLPESPTRRASPSSTAPRWRRRTSPAPPRSCSSSTAAGRRSRSSRRSSRRPARPGPTPRARRRRRSRSRAAASSRCRAPPTRRSSPTPRRSRSKLDVTRVTARSRRCSSAFTDAGGRRRHLDVSSCTADRDHRRVDRPPGDGRRPARRRGELPVVARAAPRAPQGQNYGFVVLRKGNVTRRIPYLSSSSRPALATVDAVPLQEGADRRHASGASRCRRYCYPGAPFGSRLGLRRPADGRDRRRDALRRRRSAAGREHRRLHRRPRRRTR